MRRILLSALVLLSGLQETTLADTRMEIVVSIPPQQWLVEKIGGDRVEVTVLVTPGESPTTYMPTDAQVTHLMQSRIYFRIGVPFERGLWFDAVSKMGRFTMVDLRDGIELRGDDPHIWLSPRLLSVQAATVTAALSLQDPNSRILFEENLEALQARLRILDEEIGQRLEPFVGRAFFVFHPSWGYFANEYGLQQVAIEVEGREPSDRELTVLQSEAREAEITTVFVQPQIHGRGAKAFAAAIDARLEILDPLAAVVAVNLAETADKMLESFGGRKAHE